MEEIRKNLTENLELKEQIIVGLRDERDGLKLEVRKLSGDCLNLDMYYRNVCEQNDGLEVELRRVGEELRRQIESFEMIKEEYETEKALVQIYIHL